MNPAIKKFILEQLLDTAKNGGLGRNEMIKDIVMTTEEWCLPPCKGYRVAHVLNRSPDNGMLTPSMKLQRPHISKTYEKQIEVSYSHITCIHAQNQ